MWNNKSLKYCYKSFKNVRGAFTKRGHVKAQFGDCNVDTYKKTIVALPPTKKISVQFISRISNL